MNTSPALRIAVVAVVALFALASPPAQASPEAAHAHYTRAIELVRQRDLRGAKAEFEAALRESPHPVVVFNLARVCLDLGEREEARRYAEEFLATAPPDTPEQQRKDARRILDELGPAPSPAGDARAEPPKSPSAAVAPAPPPDTATPRPAPARKDTGLILAPPPPARPLNADARSSQERGKIVGITLGATGAALLAAGTGVLIWNAGRAADAEEEQTTLEAGRPAGDVADQQGLQQVLAYERAVSDNRAAFRSVEQFDVVGWSLVGAGATLVATGVVLVLTHAGPSGTTLALTRDRVSLSLRF